MTEQLAFTLTDFAPACALPPPDELHDLARLDGVPEPLFRFLTRAPRHSDVLAEYADLTALLAEGYTEPDLRAVTGLNHAALHRRLRLAALVPEIRALHQVTPHPNAILEACAKLPAPIQSALAEQARANGTGRLTAADLAEAKRARAATARATLPDDLFTAAPLPPSQFLSLAKDAPREGLAAGAGGNDWRATVHTQLTQILQILPLHQAASVRAAVQQALDDLEFIAAVAKVSVD